MDRQQCVLRQVFELLGMDPAPEIAQQPVPAGRQQCCIGLPVTVLGQLRKAHQGGLVGNHRRAALATGVSSASSPPPRTTRTKASATHSECSGHHASG